MTLRTLWTLATVSACSLAGCAGAPPGERGDPYAPVVQPAQAGTGPPPAGVIGPGQRYPIPATPPSVPKLTTIDELISPPPPPAGDSQATATSPIVEPRLAPPLSNVPRDEPDLPLEEELFQPGQIVARVGDQIVLYGEVAPLVNQMLKPYLDSAQTASDRQEILSQRESLTEQVVKQVVETKLLYDEFLREIPREKLDEAKKNIKSQVRTRFETGLAKARQEIASAQKGELEKVLRRDPVLMRLALLMQEQHLDTLTELDSALRREGTSLERQIAFITEQQLGQEVVRQHINLKPEVTHQEMLNYYREHAQDFAMPAKARFEILTVYYKNFPSQTAAERAIAEMGNAVYLGGAAFAAVAQKSSQEPNAPEGGQYGWTTKGSLASEVIDAAIFSLPVGKLSQILRDERGCHIVRVQERIEAGQIPFTEAQTKIREAIVAQKRNAQYKEYVEKLRKNNPVWTIYEDRNLARQQGAQNR